jgi:hypothetical protein
MTGKGSCEKEGRLEERVEESRWREESGRKVECTNWTRYNESVDQCTHICTKNMIGWACVCISAKTISNFDTFQRG